MKKEWLTTTNVGGMISALLSQRVSSRKLRLFGCACCRRIWELIPDDRSRNAVTVAEEYADGRVEGAALVEAAAAAGAAHAQLVGATDLPYNGHFATRACACVVRPIAGESAKAWHGVAFARQMQRMAEAGELLPAHDSHPLMRQAMREEQMIMADLIREIFRNPFRPVAFDPAWRTSDVLLLAQGIYDDRAFDRMPILADALQDAGCANDDILNHCRDPKQVHTRGCWVVDLVLGKE